MEILTALHLLVDNEFFSRGTMEDGFWLFVFQFFVIIFFVCCCYIFDLVYEGVSKSSCTNAITF